jgi:probable rRNA maturation factor
LETIIFNNNGISPGSGFTNDFKQFLVSIFKAEKVAFKRVAYIFCKDDFLLSLNQQFLHHDTLTDIITFNLSEPGTAIMAEIYISIDRVHENAVLLKTVYKQELFRVMIHGILHLCGYNDHTLKQKQLMRKKENHYLSLLGST